MLNQSPSLIVKPLLGLSLSAVLLCIGLILAMTILGQTGFTSTDSPIVTCNTYETLKYENLKDISYQVRFVQVIVTFVFLSIEVIFAIKSLLKMIDMKLANAIGRYKWVNWQLSLRYICISLAILQLIPYFIYYITSIVEKENCSSQAQSNRIIFIFISSLALILLIIYWILILKFSLSISQSEKKINIEILQTQIRSKQKNIFQIQEMLDNYKTNINQGREVIQPLIIQNPPIPLIPQIIEAQNYKKYMYPQNQDSDHSEKNSKVSNGVSKNIKMNSSQPIRERTKSISPSKLLPQKQSNMSLQIQKRKAKFRQLNPYKIYDSLLKSNDDNEINQQEEIEVDPAIMMKNLPKKYGEYVKQSKRPKRKAPDISYIEQLMRKQAEQQAKVEAANQKPFLKKYLQPKQKNILDKSDEIQLFQQKQIKLILPYIQKQAQILYHKPKKQQKPKNRKLLFEEQQLVQPNTFDEKRQKQIVINKVKDKSPRKSPTEANSNIMNSSDLKFSSPQKQMTPEEALLKFLKGKYTKGDEQQ